MWQRFTEKSRQAVFAAQQEANRFNTLYVNTEHLLLALLRDEENVACRILKRMGFAPQTLYAALERKADMGEIVIRKPTTDYELTPRCKRVIDLAYDEARQLSNNYIGTEHLLIGLIREQDGMAARVLIAQGVELERTRREVMALQDSESAASAPASLTVSRSDALSYPSPATTATGLTASAAAILFDRAFRKLSPEQQQALQTDGLHFSELPPTFYVVMKVAMEAWNTQDTVVMDHAGKLRVQQTANGNKLFYTAQTSVTLITTILTIDD